MVSESWKFENNWGLTDVRLVHIESSTIFDVSHAFKDHMASILSVPPLAAPSVAIDVLPGDSVSQVGRPSSDASKGDDGASSVSKAVPAKFRKVLRANGGGMSVAAPSGTGLAGPSPRPRKS